MTGKTKTWAAVVRDDDGRLTGFEWVEQPAGPTVHPVQQRRRPMTVPEQVATTLEYAQLEYAELKSRLAEIERTRPDLRAETNAMRVELGAAGQTIARDAAHEIERIAAQLPRRAP